MQAYKRASHFSISVSASTYFFDLSLVSLLTPSESLSPTLSLSLCHYASASPSAFASFSDFVSVPVAATAAASVAAGPSPSPSPSPSPYPCLYLWLHTPAMIFSTLVSPRMPMMLPPSNCPVCARVRVCACDGVAG